MKSDYKKKIKQLAPYTGIILIVLGILMFAVDYFAKIDSNAFLLTALFIVLSGVVAHIIIMKREP
jgi:multisubunit Na+/H+ antiporter MnhG subunit